MTRKEALGLRREKLVALSNGTALRNRPRKMTLRQFKEAHREFVRTKVGEGTLAEYSSAFQHAEKALGEDFPISRIERSTVAKIQNHLNDKGLAPATVNKILRALRAAFACAVYMELIARNPFKGCKMPKADAREKRIFSTIEIGKLVEASGDLWWATLIRVASDTGVRKMELLHLRWSDIDFEKASLSVTPRRGGSFLSGGAEYPIFAWALKTKSSQRTVPLPEAALAALGKQVEVSDGSAYVFLSLRRLNQIRRRVRSDGSLPVKFDLVPVMRKHFREIQQRAALRPLGCLHDLRKSYGTRLASAIPMHVLQEYMGHKDIGTTSRYYLKTTDSDAEKVRQALRAVA